MLMTYLTFPEHFVWGTATSAYQIEGAWNIDGRGESIWDRFAHTPGLIQDASSGDIACDHYQRWREDLALMKQIGVQAYRFSIAWPRILPQGHGQVNQAGIDFYSRLVDALLEHDILPFATLYHWDLPQALQDAGGWPNRATVSAFVAYADVISRALGDRIKHWITHNEPWCASMLGHQMGVHAPGIQDWRQALASSHHLLLSHGLAVPVLRQNSPGAEVGITLNFEPAIPASPSAADADAARHHDGYLHRWFLDPLYGRHYPADMLADYRAAGYLPADELPFVQPGDLQAIAVQTDFLGVNYYRRVVVRSTSVSEQENLAPTVYVAPASEWTDMGWEVAPASLYDVLCRVSFEYRPRKVYITENGASYGDGPQEDGQIHDQRRQRYLRDHLMSAFRAVQAGVPLAGYFVWSFLDNFEWDRGYTQRFGITWVDYATMQRTLKDSARWYQQVIGDNGLAIEG